MNRKNAQTVSATFPVQKHGILFGVLLWLEIDCLGPHALTKRMRKKAHVSTLNNYSSNWKEVVIMLTPLSKRLARVDCRRMTEIKVTGKVSYSDKKGLPTYTLSTEESGHVSVVFNDFNLTYSAKPSGRSNMLRIARKAKRIKT